MTHRAELTRFLRVPPERVFEAFASPEMVASWLSPAPEIRLQVLEYDFRVQGGYRFRYHVPDGQVMHVNGSFREIVRPTHIVFSWVIEPPDEHAGLDSEVSVSIAADRDGAVLTIIHERLVFPGSRERHSAGWQGALDRLQRLLNAIGVP